MLRRREEMMQQLECQLEEDLELWWRLLMLDAIVFALWWVLRVWAELLR